MATPRKRWLLFTHERMAVERLAAQMRTSPVVAQLLLNRGLSEPTAARRFLEAPLTGLHPPALLPGVSEAARRLLAAVRQGRRIVVYGDYDVDGITGTAILYKALHLLGGQVDFYLPNRLEEGYGLNIDALRRIAVAGARTVVTVDCGITSVAEADEARRLGLELIITDHHEPREELPPADVLVHPCLPGSGYPFGELSGSGVALKVAWALCQEACGAAKVTPRLRNFLLEAVTLAALGLVADVVPLYDENRILVRHGLQRLWPAPSLGLHALIQEAGLANLPTIRAEDVGFKLAPRLNAAGRLGCARLVVELLTTASAQRAADLARFLEGQNQQRQQLERRIFAEIRQQLGDDLDGRPALVLADERWHPGIIGIVAGRLVELYGRPVLLIALAPDRDGLGRIARGSGRSIAGFPLHEALATCRHHLLSFGGHAAAAGFSLRAEAVDAFRERFCAVAAEYFPDGPPTPPLVLDAEIPLSALTPGLLRDLDRLEPFGPANRRPVFLAGGLRVVGSPRCLGPGERHLSFRVQQGGTSLRAIAFGMADRLEELLSAQGQVCLAFRPRLNEWQGIRTIELEVVDFQAGPRVRLATAAPPAAMPPAAAGGRVL
ncbi:MAG: single-stranded-DNA-specific exonuclease RecJ [Gemmataceae bacterium]|nr:single-stranded-DNA-specific exonuclease RecJ [Gemmataceae bacterium]MDW8267395.1 single-stranded-DNA-specific exonuclease RecJ [Gemmataceae bacterium]